MPPELRKWMWVFPPILGVLVVAVALTVYLVKNVLPGHCVIPQNGMYPGLPAGSYLFVVRHPYTGPSEVARGDIVVFDATDQGQQTQFIWRVVALPGDRVQTKDDQVLVNGDPLERQQIRTDGEMVIFQETNGDAQYEVAYRRKAPEKPPPDVNLVLAPGQFFVMGDNRHEASDSRYRGPIAFESIVAKAR